MIAAIYSRKSKFTGKGESIENQIQLCIKKNKVVFYTTLFFYILSYKISISYIII